MRVMIDTNVIIWWQTDDPRLSGRTRAILADPRHILVASVASFWEMSIKFRLDKLDIPGSGAFRRALGEQVQILNVQLGHLVALDTLPNRANHKDPFDRLILAQALSEDTILMTGDRQMMGYGVPCIGVG